MYPIQIQAAIDKALKLDTTISIDEIRGWLKGDAHLLSSDADISKVVTATKRFKRVAKGLWTLK